MSKKTAPKLEVIDSRAARIVETGRRVLNDEAEGLHKVATSLSTDFSEAVLRILKVPAEGRIVFSGVGKLSFIAMKLSASFASFGFPSFFLNSTDAVHGDLGRLTASDILLVLSNSGDTSEVVRMVAAVRKLGCTTISITAGADSYIAKHSDYCLLFPKLAEAGSLGLAPTTSTTAILALGDALLMAAAEERGFTREEFALRHPGGILGRNLMQVSEIMRTAESLCIVSQSMLCREVLHSITLTKGRPGAAAVVDEKGILVGVFTDGDLRRCLDQNANFLNVPVSEVMGRAPKTISPDNIAEQALRIMSTHQIDQVIVTDAKGTPIGLLDIQDIVRVS